jgi:hypothetical protein
MRKTRTSENHVALRFSIFLFLFPPQAESIFVFSQNKIIIGLFAWLVLICLSEKYRLITGLFWKKKYCWLVTNKPR